MYLIKWISFVLFVISIGVISGSQPTKETICANPVFDAGMAISGVQGKYSLVKRYLFMGSYVMPYDWDRHEIDWNDIKEISQKFANTPITTITKVNLAFGTRDKAYLLVNGTKGQQFFSYKRDGDGFLFENTYTMDTVGFPYIRWEVTNDTGVSSMLFFDSMPISGTSSKADTEIEYKGGKFKVEYSSALDKSKIRLPIEVFPNTLIFDSLSETKVKIPVEFDAYYQTYEHEIIFFKGESACAYMARPLSYKEQSYCHTFVNTRKIIGCYEGEASNTGAEVNPEEPDIDTEGSV